MRKGVAKWVADAITASAAAVLLGSSFSLSYCFAAAVAADAVTTTADADADRLKAVKTVYNRNIPGSLCGFGIFRIQLAFLHIL